MRKVVTALTAALALCAPAGAQDLELLGADDGPEAARFEAAGARHVISQLDGAGEPLVGWRYAPFDMDVIALVPQGEAGHRETYRLEAHREYLFQGACDRNCGDIDLEILGADGIPAARDTTTAGWPIVSFTPPQAGRYTVRVWATRCAAEFCYVGVRGYSRELETLNATLPVAP